MSASFDPAALRAIIQRFAGRRVAVLGDCMLDRYLWGRVDRISPEAPVPVVTIERETASLGGAANVAHNLVALGATPVLLGLVGDDALGSQLTAELVARGVGTDGVLTDRARRTTVKTRVIAHQQQVVRADQEDTEDVAGPALAALEQALDRALPEVESVILSDYGK